VASVFLDIPLFYGPVNVLGWGKKNTTKNQNKTNKKHPAKTGK